MNRIHCFLHHSGLRGVVLWSLISLGTIWGTGPLAHAEMYSLTDLGAIVGGGPFSPVDINDVGQVVGSANTTVPPPITHAFLYQNGALTDLGTLGKPDSAASGINNAGQVVGGSSAPSGINNGTVFHAFLYENGMMKDLGTLGGFESAASDINNAGQVVGSAQISSVFDSHAFLYENGAMKDLGTLDGSDWNGQGS